MMVRPLGMRFNDASLLMMRANDDDDEVNSAGSLPSEELYGLNNVANFDDYEALLNLDENIVQAVPEKLIN